MRMWQVALRLAAIAGVSTLATVVLLRVRKHRSHTGSSHYHTVKLTNNVGASVEISSLGAAITRLIVPGRNGSKADVVLGWPSIADYATAEPVTYFGVIVGRVANRISNAQFQLEGETYKLAANNGPNALHGGPLGLHKRTWGITEVSAPDFTAVVLQYDSPEGEEGYPGAVTVLVTYKLMRDSNELSCTIKAVADALTPVNIAQHSYFNLAGHSSGRSILDHVVHMPSADHYTPVTPDAIPTGEIAPVAGTPFDFTQPHAVGERIAQVPGGYDHNFVLFNMGPQARFITKNGAATQKPKLAVTLKDPKSGRRLDILTTAPGVQFYSGNFLDDSVRAKGGGHYFKHAGLCMETQGFPDAINQPGFPSVLLRPEDTYVHEVVYKFSVE